MNGDVQYYLATLAFKNREKLEYFHSRIIRLQQEIILYGETVSPTRRYTEAFSKSDKRKAFITTKMKDIITFHDNKIKSAVYTGGNIHGLYNYLEMIGTPTTLTTSGQRSCNFGPSSCTNNDTESLQPVLTDLRTRHNIICKCCGIIGHKADACIIRGPKSLPQSLRRKMNQFNTLHCDEPTDPPIEWNIKPT